jgi:hypothetical protein
VVQTVQRVQGVQSECDTALTTERAEEQAKKGGCVYPHCSTSWEWILVFNPSVIMTLGGESMYLVWLIDLALSLRRRFIATRSLGPLNHGLQTGKSFCTKPGYIRVFCDLDEESICSQKSAANGLTVTVNVVS